ncbi:MAG: citrate lyase holo-[acyl-carrier protein] synthase [Tissierellia bacterium]|nr:citrate lyase holo-[acyl-carrier protein] synthase [Tissierellia bacterium]
MSKENINFQILNQILQSREERAQKQIDILYKYPHSLISFTLNTPGSIKDNQLYRKIHNEGFDLIQRLITISKLEIMYKEYINKPTGAEGYVSVDTEAELLKSIMVSLEKDHPLGRIFDIDVFDKDHNQMSRTDLGLETRTCLLCNKDARICMREKNHTYEELIARIEEVSKDYFKIK